MLCFPASFFFGQDISWRYAKGYIGGQTTIGGYRIFDQPLLDGFDLGEHRVSEDPGESLPRIVAGSKAPPIKCQGIKTRLVPFILSSICWDGKGAWIEPFLGSGTVLFNLAPRRALVADTNPHIIEFYRDIARGNLTRDTVGRHLEREGRLLAQRGEEHYYEVRERFNARPTSLDLLFLNRACFNGVMRFNRKGGFNVPFCRKPERFSRAYVTRIANQVSWVTSLVKGRDWVFEVADWRETISKAAKGDFVYADPPYSGRHVDYFNGWTNDESVDLLARLRNLSAGFALSTWKQNKHRRNPFLESEMTGTVVRTTRHFYHVGSREDLRGEMEEALIVSKSFASKHELTLKPDFR